MKIIKEPKLTTCNKTCIRCGCEFEYDCKDLISVFNINSAAYVKRIECPFCHNEMKADDKIVREFTNMFVIFKGE